MNNNISIWIAASRPKTLPAALVPVMVGSSLAFNSDNFNILLSIIALVCLILIQIGTNFTNDLYDFYKGADNEKRTGPIRVLASGLVTINEMKIAITLVFTFAFLLGLILVAETGIVIFIIGIISILAGLAYTAGPYPLAYNGLGDLFVFLFFGIIGTAGTYYLHIREFNIISVLAGIPVGALITNILVVNNYRDIETDKEAGKNTLAVIFGKNFAKFQYLFLFLISFVIPVIFFFNFNMNFIILLPLILIPMAFILVKMLFILNGSELNKTLELTAKFSAVYGLLFSAGLIL